MIIEWLELEDILVIQEHQISRYGGLKGVRDENLLISAFNRPLNKNNYDNENDIFILAASLGYGLAKNHPFLDGNKRSALAGMEVFLSLNGFELIQNISINTQTIVKLASGELSEEALAEFLRHNTIAVSL